MRMLDRKLLRDLRRMWAQALAIALVMASGVATLRAGERRLPFARRDARRVLPALPVRRHLRRGAAGARSPSSSRSSTIPGVAAAEPRITQLGPSRCGGSGRARDRPGRLGSRPGRARASTSLHLREGRLPERERTDEVTVNEAFAKAHGMRIGRPLQGAPQRQEARAQGCGHRPLAGVHLCAGSRRPDARRPALRHAVDVGEGAGRHCSTSMAPSTPSRSEAAAAAPPSPRSSSQLDDAAGALRGHRGIRPQGPALPRLPRRRAEAARRAAAASCRRSSCWCRPSSSTSRCRA